MHDESDFETMERRLIVIAKASRSPVNGSIELTPVCNMNCEMCYVRLSAAEQQKLGALKSADDYIKLAHEMFEKGVLFLLLTGGEPLLYPEFRYLYKELQRMGFILTLNTNATLIDEQWADFFAEYKPRRINITLYGTSNETYESLCHLKDGFDRTINAIKLLRERDIDVKIGGSITNTNLHEVNDLYRIGQELDCPVVLDSYMMSATRERSSKFNEGVRLAPETAAKIDLLQSYKQIGNEFYPYFVRNMVEQYESNCNYVEPIEGMKCMAGSCSFAINWNGKMKPCVISTQPELDVFKEGFEKSWNMIVDYCDHLGLTEKCKVCPVQHLCPTCPVAEIVEEGRLGLAPEYLCAYAWEKLRLLRMMLDIGEPCNYEKILSDL